jgi:hypothetical protein
MLFEFKEPGPVTLKNGVALALCHYLEEVILSQPQWRASPELVDQAEELLDQVEQVQAETRDTYVIRSVTWETLKEQMKLANAAVVQSNALLVRPSIRYLRHVQGALKKEEPKESSK